MIKKILIILLSVVLVLAIGAGTCAALALSEPEEGVFAGQMGEKSIDLKALMGGLLSGNVHLPYEMINCTIREKLEEREGEPYITGLMLAPSAQDNVLWARARVRRGGREWVATMQLRLNTVQGDKGLTALELTPVQMSVGKLPMPSVLWPAVLEELAGRGGLICEDGVIRYDLPELNLPLVQLKNIRTEPDGFVLELSMGSLWG